MSETFRKNFYYFITCQGLITALKYDSGICYGFYVIGSNPQGRDFR
ncbi:MAG: hypothetical protein HDS68_05980 [Bacteroidales bacterium]|nr:hypothetical protein [Bacteroidales bacterium]